MPVHDSRGFTLLEVLIALVIIALLFGLVLPNYQRTLDTEQLSESATRFKAAIAMCRAQAMNEARAYQLVVRPDGSLKIVRQLDAIYAPHVYVPVHESWAQQPVLLDRVFVEAVLALPEGPPPFDVQDQLVEFDELVDEPIPVGELENGLTVTFAPDGLSDSAQWFLRDTDGRGRKVTLDGRLGRVTIEPIDSMPREQVERPEPLPDDEPDPLADMTEQDLLQEYMP